ncbi:cytosolic protein, partial [Bacillus sp. 196mf]|uniref:cytosolic protein n=1 Tax=Bacillus sp. 196mf TaxID=1761754 RepID=UPI000D7C8273
ANAIIIQPIVEEVSDKTPTEMTEKCPTKKTNTISLKQNIKDIHIRKEDDIQSHVNDKDFIDYRVPQSMRMKLQTAFGPKIINESFQNARNIAKKAAKKFNLLADTDVFHNLLANASSVLFSKTQKFEHNGTLMKNPIGYFTRTFKKMVYDYIDSFREKHILEKRKTTVCTDGGIFYNWLEEDRSTVSSTNPISKSLLSGIFDKISAEEADEMGLY